MSTKHFQFLNGPLKGELGLLAGQFLPMVYDGEHLVLTEEFGSAIPDNLPSDVQRQITWALAENEEALLVMLDGQSYLYLRAPLNLSAYSFLTKID